MWECITVSGRAGANGGLDLCMEALRRALPATVEEDPVMVEPSGRPTQGARASLRAWRVTLCGAWCAAVRDAERWARQAVILCERLCPCVCFSKNVCRIVCVCVWVGGWGEGGGQLVRTRTAQRWDPCPLGRVSRTSSTGRARAAACARPAP